MGRVVATRVPDEVYEALRRMAEERGLTIAGMARELLLGALGVSSSKQSVNGCKRLEEEIEALKRRLEELEEEVRKISGITRFMPSPSKHQVNRRKRSGFL